MLISVATKSTSNLSHPSSGTLWATLSLQYPYSLPLDSAGETAALVAHDGVDALLDVAQHLGGKGSSATAGGNSQACARTTWPAKVASRFSRWLRGSVDCDVS